MVAPRDADARVRDLVAKWADGKATLKEVRGYTDEELYAAARAGHVFFNQGLIQEARAIFQGLFAVSPRDAYFARALAVVEWAAGNPDGALGAFDVAIKLDPDHPAGYLGRAEVRIASGQRREAQSDVAKAISLAQAKDPLKIKAEAMLAALAGRRR
ncbi:MAG: tetratricopeptide repeat protein [Deltaproteobacteria bacterium]|nr:tetratricopeptide repeat protein [Deltaproteobacteria bacterium]